jgi:PAS domain S-box-containing protein
MDLRTKTLIALIGTLIAVTILILASLSSLFLASYADLDEERVAADTMRAVNAVNNEIRNLDATVTDYAAWDDTYAFMENGNPEYLNSNFVDSTYLNLGLNVVIIAAPDGTIVYGSGFDLDEEEKTDLPPNLLGHLSPDGPLMESINRLDNTAGLLFLEEGPMMVAAHPVLRSDYSGVPRGMLIMGRALDEELILRIEETIALPITTYSVNDASLPPALFNAAAVPGGHNPYTVETRDHEVIEGYATLTDIYGDGGIVLMIEETRDIYHQGERTILYNILTILAIGGIAGLIMIRLLDRNVLSRLARLSTHVTTIGARGDPSRRISMDGDDELSNLARAINIMLSRIEEVQQGLQKSEARYRGIVNDQTQMICRWLPDGTVTYANEVLCAYVKKPCTEIVGTSFTPTIPEGDVHTLKSGVATLTPGNPARTFSFRVTTGSGDLRWQRWTLRGIFDEEGRLLEYQGVGEDITDRKEAEKSLLNLAIQSAGLSAWDWDFAAGRMTFTRTAPLVTGHAPAEIEGDPAIWQQLIHPDDRDAVVALLEDHIRDAIPVFEAEFRILCRDGGFRWIRNTGKVVSRSEDGDPLRMTGIWQDVNEIRQYQEAMVEANKKLNLLNSITRHDILNQVTALLGYVELSGDIVHDAGMASYLDRMHRIGRTIQQQIEFTRDYQELGVHGPVWHDTGRTVAAAAGNLDLGAVSLAAEVDGLVIYADPLLERVFYNLIDNTLNHAGDRVSTIRIHAETAGDSCILVYEDDGCGIPDEQKAIIFNAGVGSINGFGLFLIREILGITGITISERGIHGAGARFEIRIPPEAWRQERRD